jgi:cell wall-associated NlpC family hydrolase
MTRPALINAARSYIGAPWRHRGRDVHGMDCIGLVLAAARDVGVSLPEPPPYGTDRRGDELLRGVQAVAPIARGEPRPGDVLLFRAGRLGCHLGILADHPRYRCASLVHCPVDRGAVCEEVLTGEMWGAFVSRHELPGVV